MGEPATMLGWIGTGRMGYPMAEWLLRNGHALQVWNRTRAKAEPLAALGATLCDRAADLAVTLAIAGRTNIDLVRQAQVGA